MTGTPDLAALLKIPTVERDLGFDISPDGSQVAFSWNCTGRWEIYLLALDDSSPPRKITQGEGAKFAPRWSPDGGRLAYVLDLDGAENYDLCLYHAETGEHQNLTPGTPHALSPAFSWSPDGRQIAFCSDANGRFDTYVMPSEGGPARMVLDAPNPDSSVRWSPDGRMLAVASQGAAQDSWTTIVPRDGGEPKSIGLEDEPISAKDPCWSPDGQRLAFASDLHGSFQIGLYALADGSISWITEGDGEKEHPDWSSDGFLTYVHSQGPKGQLAIMDLESGTVSLHAIEPGVIHTPACTPGVDQVFFIFDNPRHPPDLWAFDRAEAAFRQLTHSLPPAIDQDAFLLPEEIWYPGLDGVDVPALLYRPRGGDQLPPAVLYVHGGPNWLTQVTWDPLVQHMVCRGWAVLAPNYRGSTGYGRAWMNANRFDLGGVDTADVTAGADYLLRAGVADPARIAVTGRSWGGYLTMTCLTQFPERWAAGSAVVPFLNWFTGHANSREDLQHWDIENFGDPVTNRELWYQRSPFFFLDQVQAPVQLICGEHDVRCPASESKQAYETLTGLGKECDFRLYPGEGHSFLKIENQVKSKQQVIAFLAKHLE